MCSFLIKHNGRRYVLVGVTRRQHRQSPGTPRQRGHKTITVQGGFGACFCRHGTNFIGCRRGRGTNLLSSRKIVPVYKAIKWALAQCRGTMLIEARNCQDILELNCMQMRVSGCKNHYKFVLGAGAKQKP
jgi:hypothetical protein